MCNFTASLNEIMTLIKPTFHWLIIIGLCSVCCNNPLLAQQSVPKTTIDSTIVTSFSRSFDSLFLGKTSVIDTSLTLFSRFDPLSKENLALATLSNAGMPARSLLFTPDFHGGYDFHPAVYQHYLRSSKNIRYLKPLLPFTELNYLMGSQKEQHLQVVFNRQIVPRTYVGMDYHIINSPGPYKNSKTDNNSVYFTALHQSKDKRYGIVGHYFYNRLINNENGGLFDDLVFEQSKEIDRRVIAVNLIDAQNTVKQSGFGFEQYLILAPPTEKVPDSLPPKQQFKLGRISHQLEYLRNQFIYKERSPLEKFYQAYDIVLDSTQTYDSTFQSVLINRFQWSSLGYTMHDKQPPFHLYAGIEIAAIRQADSNNSSNYWQLNPYGGIQIALWRSTFIDAKALLVTGNQGAGDLLLDGKIRQFLGTEQRNLGFLFGNVKVINQSPSWFHQQYQSNHFRWSNDFAASRYFSLQAGYQFRGLQGGANVHLLDRHIYMGTDARPHQTSGTARVVQLFGNMSISPGKFHLMASVYSQYSDNDTILRLPALTAKIRATFTTDLFKGAATFQAGLESYWFTEYYADAWMPALRTFYLQNEKKIGNYPFADAHLALKVKRARIFAKYTNLFGLTQYYYYYTSPHYPLLDPRLYIGVSWKFFQ